MIKEHLKYLKYDGACVFDLVSDEDIQGSAECSFYSKFNMKSIGSGVCKEARCAKIWV